MKTKLLPILNVVVLCIVIFSVSYYFVYQGWSIGAILIALGALCLVSLRPFRITVASTWPDIIFGIIDNGILAIMAFFGGTIAGVVGAVVGGVVGNAITDGVAGMFEGYWAERMSNSKRTVLGSAIGKMAGCLLGAGGVLTVVELARIIF